jgi:hypothetical protein
MDVTVSQAAEKLGTTVQRVTRAVERLGIERVPQVVEQPQRGRPARAIHHLDLERLRLELGSTPSESDLTREELFVLAAFNLSPFGFRSIRAAASAANVSPTTAALIVERLIDKELIRRLRVNEVLSGRVVQRDVVEANRLSSKWWDLIYEIRATSLPSFSTPPEPKRAPRRFWHLFWNSSPAAMPVSEYADFLTSRLILSRDATAVAWAAICMPPSSIAKAARLRHVTEHDRHWLLSVADNRMKEGA